MLVPLTHHCDSSTRLLEVAYALRLAADIHEQHKCLHPCMLHCGTSTSPSQESYLWLARNEGMDPYSYPYIIPRMQ